MHVLFLIKMEHQKFKNKHNFSKTRKKNITFFQLKVNTNFFEIISSVNTVTFFRNNLVERCKVLKNKYNI